MRRPKEWDFDYGWPRHGEWISVPIDPDERGAAIVGKYKNGKNVLRYFKWRFALYLMAHGDPGWVDAPKHIEETEWLNANIGSKGWSASSFQGGWMYVDFYDKKLAALFKLLRC
jgi:hypothetical protein